MSLFDRLTEGKKKVRKTSRTDSEALDFISVASEARSWEGLVQIEEDAVVEYDDLEELERIVPCPKGKRRVRGACKSVMTQVAGPGIKPKRRPGPQRVVRRPHPGPVRVSDMTVDDIMVELSDLPNKFGTAGAFSTRTGLGTALPGDKRPEQEKKEALRDALKQRKAKLLPAS